MNQLVKMLADGLAKSSDVVLAVAMAAMLGALIVPLPAWLLDLGLAINLAAAVALLVAALYARDALKVTSFPTLLLVTTLFRLALNVSSTRLALAEGHAGEVIQAFGEFVVRGRLRRRRGHLRHPHAGAVPGGGQGRRARGRGLRALHPGRDAGQADVHRRRPARGGHRPGAGARAAARPRARVADVRRDGRRDEVREGRRHRRPGHRRGEPPGRHLHRRAAERDDAGRGGLAPTRSSPSATAWSRRFPRCASRSPRAWWSRAWPPRRRTTRWARRSARSSSASRKALWVVAGLCVALAAMPGMPHLTFLGLGAAAGRTRACASST